MTTPAHVEWACGEVISPSPSGRGGGVAGEGWLADTRIRCKHIRSLARRVADEARRVADEARRVADVARRVADQARRVADQARRVAEKWPIM